MPKKKQVIIDVGEKVHIIMRRHFQDDVRRHFVGEVVAVSDQNLRAQGYSFLYDPLELEYRKLPTLRTRIFGMTDSGLITNVLSPDVDIERLYYRFDKRRLIVTDGAEFSLEISEFA